MRVDTAVQTVWLMSEVALLNREMYTEAEAARLLDVAPSTLHWWLEGGTRNGRTYPPVLRPEPTGGKVVTWGEFVEAGLLRQYRRKLNVKLPELRIFIDSVRRRTGVPYPLAHARPFVGEGRALILEAQDEADLPADLHLIAEVRGQRVLLPAADLFLRRVKWDQRQGIAVMWRPHDDDKSPVRIDPEVRFGSPSIAGISTSVLWEQMDAGASAAEVADEFGVQVDQVEWAHAYEMSARHRPLPDDKAA